MPDIFRHIRNAFRKPRLKGEDWLDPSDRVLENIERVIQSDDKKDKPFFLYLITAVIFIIALPIVLFFNSPDQNIRAERQTVVLEEQKDFSKSRSDVVSKKDVAFQKNLKKSANSDKVKTIDKSEAVQSSQIENKIAISTTSNIRPLKERQIIQKQEIVYDVESRISIANKPVPGLSIGSPTLEQKVSRTASSVFNLIEEPNIINLASAIDKLELLRIREINLQSKLLPILPVFIDKQNKVIRNRFYLQAGAGVVSWSFKLNDAYSEIVEPAAFEKSNGLGYSTSLRIGKQLNKRIDLSAQLKYEAIQFTSGHNSEIKFDNSLTEQNETLMMATPLGLVSNEVALLRSADTSMGETDLTIDLTNDHKMTAFEFSLMVDVNLISNNEFKISLSPGFGVLQVLNAENTLSSLETNDVSISDGGSIVEGEFESVIKTTPVGSLNLNLMKSIDQNWEVGLQIESALNLKPIQELYTINTRVHRFGAQATLRRIF